MVRWVWAGGYIFITPYKDMPLNLVRVYAVSGVSESIFYTLLDVEFRNEKRASA